MQSANNRWIKVHQIGKQNKPIDQQISGTGQKTACRSVNKRQQIGDQKRMQVSEQMTTYIMPTHK